MRAHSGTQWKNGRGALSLDLIRKQCNLSASSGIQGVSLFGEISPYAANAEFNYRALEYFADTPDATVPDFARDVMSPLLGGETFAEQYLAFAPLETKSAEAKPAVDAIISRILPAVRDAEARRRWLWLAARLDSFRWDVENPKL